MNSVYRDVFRAIHEGRWLSIEYRNKADQVTRYWIGIRELDVFKKTLSVEGLHLGKYSLGDYSCIYLDSILSSRIIDGSFYPVNKKLIQDISENPHKYLPLFDNVPNLKILNYLEDCNRLDGTPYKTDFTLLRYLDRESFQGEEYPLSDEQFHTIVKAFQQKAEKTAMLKEELHIQELAVNVMSIHTPRGLYVLACRKLRLDVKCRSLKPDEEITICTEFVLDGVRESIRRYLDGEDYVLLEHFERNQERIKDCITRSNRQISGVDDMPYLIGLGMDLALDLHSEYASIIEACGKGELTVPLKAFFGDLLSRPIRRKEYPIALLDRKINLDQLLAINNAMKYPLAYIQGPPGTGKTSTIRNTICTAFFNERTVLFSSYNNHPIDSVFEELTGMTYNGKRIPFPIIRLGNVEKLRRAIRYINEIYEQTRGITIYESTLDRKKDNRAERAKRLSHMLKEYESGLYLRERRETIERVLQYGEGQAKIQMLPFRADLEGRQREQVKREIEKRERIDEKEVMALLDGDVEGLLQYLYYTSARYIKRLDEPKYEELRNILSMPEGQDQVDGFSRYLGSGEKLKALLRVFPIVVTTCISAHKLGEPRPYFDMTVIDEASQCNTAVSLVPVLRGENLMLVGDPQQLNPVILLSESVNEKLRGKYSVPDEYDYRKNSIYKTFLACDSVSDEVLLRSHYRCHEKIIGFGNKKYYNSRLKIKSNSKEPQPLLFMDVKDSRSYVKNTSPAEAAEILRYAALNRDRSIGVITPFVNQKKLIEQRLEELQLKNVVCGTVHAFQGDEQDVVLFSTAITDQTTAGTYEWLKNNRELINVATSRAKDRLVILSSSKNIERLHQKEGDDDLYELVRYVRSNGNCEVTGKETASRALGVKPFSTATEEAFLQTLNHALENIWLTQNSFTVHKEVAVSQVFQDNINCSDLFYNGRFDFVVYEKEQGREFPVLAIELDGREHFEEETVKRRDRKKNEICRIHNLELIRVENSYARRYNHIKNILINYFSKNKTV